FDPSAIPMLYPLLLLIILLFILLFILIFLFSGLSVSPLVRAWHILIIKLVSCLCNSVPRILMGSSSLKSLNGHTASSTETALREFVRIVGLLERVMQPYFARFGISGSQWGLLRALYRADQEGMSVLRLTDLSERLLIRAPSVSGAVDRLERAGLVARDSSAADHRAKHVALTPKGRQLMEKILAVHGRQVATVLGGLSSHEQKQFYSLLRRFGQHLEGLLARGIDVNVG